MSNELHRTLVRVVGVQKDGVWLCVPGWNSSVAVLRSVSTHPALLGASPRQRFFAKVNIGTEEPDELLFTEFEFPEE